MKLRYLTNTSIPQIGSGVGRSGDTVHLTDIIRDLGVCSGLVKTIGGDPQNRFEAGFTWERVLENAWADRLGARPGEVEKDGIVGSPDAIQVGTFVDPDDRIVCVGEFKFTWKSCRSFDLAENWYWTAQAMSYAHMLDLDKVVFHIFFVNGDYTSRSPEYWIAEADFTRGELKKNWEKILMHGKRMGLLR